MQQLKKEMTGQDSRKIYHQQDQEHMLVTGRKEAESFRQGIGRQDNKNLLRRQLGFEVAGLQEMPCFGHDIHCSFPPDKPHALNWHESMIECPQTAWRGHQDERACIRCAGCSLLAIVLSL